MTTRQNTAPAVVKPVQQAIYRTGHCQTGHHRDCRGTYARVDCCCTCHTPPPPPPWRVLVHGHDGRTYDIRPHTGPNVEVTRRDAGTVDVRIPDATFDEIAVGGWLHVEEMDDDQFWVRIGDLELDAHITGPTARLLVQDGEHALEAGDA